MAPIGYINILKESYIQNYLIAYGYNQNWLGSMNIENIYVGISYGANQMEFLLKKYKG